MPALILLSAEPPPIQSVGASSWLTYRITVICLVSLRQLNMITSGLRNIVGQLS